MADLKKFPVKLAVEQDGGNFYVYGSHITNFDEIGDKIDETNSLLEANNALLVDANGHLVDVNGNLVEIDGELVSINTVEGLITDAAVTAGSQGTISGKLRRISSDIDSIKTSEATIVTNTTGLATAANQATMTTNQTNGSQKTRLTDGTNDANILKSDGTAAGQNAQIVGGAYLSVPFTTTTVQAVGTTDAGNYSGVSVEVSSMGAGSTVTFQVSDDNVTWRAFNMVSTVNNTVSSNTTTTSGSFANALPARYFRVNVTGITSGTTAGVIIFKTLGSSTAIVAGQQGTWTVGSNSATGSAFPANAFGQGGKSLTASPTAATANQLTPITLDVMGEQLISSGGLVTSSVPANASNVVVKASAGRLCRVLVTTSGANAMLIHDNATTNSGTIIGSLPANAPVGSVYDFQMPAANGITIAGSATNPAVTVSWI